MNKVKGKSAGRPRRSDSNVDLKAVGLRIRQLRSQTNQEEFAKGLGISQAQLSKYELGQSAPPLGVLVTLGKSHAISVDWILTGKKSKRRLNEPLLPPGIGLFFRLERGKRM